MRHPPHRYLSRRCCLKRFVARELYRTLRADRGRPSQPQQPDTDTPEQAARPLHRESLCGHRLDGSEPALGSTPLLQQHSRPTMDRWLGFEFADPFVQRRQLCGRHARPGIRVDTRLASPRLDRPAADPRGMPRLDRALVV